MPVLLVDNLKIYYFISPVIYTNMYLMTEGKEALIIDPHGNDSAFSLLKTAGITKVTIFLTHEHPDHTCGVKRLTDSFHTFLVCHRACARSIADKRNNRPTLMTFVLAEQDKKNGTHTAKEFQKNFPVYECHADYVFEKEMVYRWRGEEFIFKATPGHSPGSCCIAWKNTLFTGDSLISGMPVITRFPGGSLDDYIAFTKPYLDGFWGNTLVLPGHGQPFSIEDTR